MLDTAPTPETIAEFVETSIRNELCFRELRNFNDKEEFLFIHPLIIEDTERADLRKLLLQNPDAFLEESRNCDMNVTRYRSYLNSDKYSEEQKKTYEEILNRHLHRQELFREILKNTIYATRIQGKDNTASA